MRSALCWTFAIALGLTAGNADAALKAEIAPAADKQGGSGSVQYTLRNTGKQDLLVLAWETPLRGVEDDLFEVWNNGRAVEYVGRHYKRGLPQPEDYIELKAGSSLSATVDLTAHYAMRETGSYSVQFVGHFHDSFAVKSSERGDAVEAISDQDLRSASISLWVDGFAAAQNNEIEGVLKRSKAGSVSFIGCSNSQASSITSGHSASKTMSADANSYLAAGKTGSRYTTWFGSYTSSNYNTIKSHFAAISDALSNKPLEFYCDCTSSAYAYVYPNQPYKIHLCNAFWQAPTSGTDSKGGTIVHETSHFDIVANTDDLAYGQTACKKLAKRASRAIKNADSHEYFAENTPALN